MQIPGYTIIKELGRGGMATVYLALQQSLDREVALKVMSPALLADESFGNRFLREAKIVAKLSHPNVIPIYDVGTSGDYYYIAMEYESGGELKKRIKAGLTVHEAVSIIKQIASALQFAHSNGYIHRDVKPDNIIFNAHGKALLTDFGVARAYDSTTKITAVGTVIGTPLYMSPEQVQGKTIDHRADLYSLGAVFFEMLMGHPPYRGDSAVTVAVKHMTDPVPLLPVKYAKLQPFFEKLLSKNADDRFQSGEEIIARLGEIDLDDIGISLLGGDNADKELSVKRALKESAVDHEAPTVLQSEPLATPASSVPHTTPIPQTSKSNTPIVLVSTALIGVLIAVGVLYFLQQSPTETSMAPSPQTSQIQSPQKPPPQATTAAATDQSRISELLALAKQNFSENRLTQPLGNNAYEKYLDVLRLDPGNSEADQGLRNMSDQYLAQLEKALQAKQFENAANLYDQAQRIYPKHPDLEQLQSNIKQAIAQFEVQQKQLAAEQEQARLAALEKARLEKVEKQRQQQELEKQRKLEEQKRLEEERLQAELKRKQQEEERAKLALLVKQKQQEKQRQLEQLNKINLLSESANDLLKQNNLNVSAVDQAYKIYNDISSIEPQYPALEKGLLAVVNAYGDMAEKELNNKKYDNAETIVQKGLAIDRDNSRLLRIRESIKQAKSKGTRVFGGF